MPIRLRPSNTPDIAYILEAESYADTRRFIDPWPEQQHLRALTDKDFAHLIVETTDTSERVGFVILAGLENRNRSVEFIRIVISEKGNGFGRATVKAVKSFAFDQRDAHRLWLDVKTFNERARSLYRQEGFREEGVLRECLRADDSYESLVIMSILEQEFRIPTISADE